MFLDSSVIVKLLVSESDSGFFEDALVGQALSASELSLTETWAALLAKERSGSITSEQRRRAWHILQERVQTEEIWLHPISSVVLRKAEQVLQRCHPSVPLRTLDAIHAAACDLSQDFPFCTTDKQMRAAAAVIGIPVFPSDEPSS